MTAKYTSKTRAENVNNIFKGHRSEKFFDVLLALRCVSMAAIFFYGDYCAANSI
jgi:hypothetical protein